MKYEIREQIEKTKKYREKFMRNKYFHHRKHRRAKNYDDGVEKC